MASVMERLWTPDKIAEHLDINIERARWCDYALRNGADPRTPEEAECLEKLGFEHLHPESLE